MDSRNIPTYKIAVKENRQRSYATITAVEDGPNDSVIVKDEVTKSALKLETPRKITLSGDAQGSILFNGSEDVVITVDVKNSRYAVKDSKGNVISDTYATKAEMSKYALKKDIDERLNYIEKILYATKNAVNNSLRKEDVEDWFSNGENSGGGDSGIIAGEDDIDNLFGSDTSTGNTNTDTSTSNTDTDTSTSGSGDDSMATEDDIDALFGGD